MQCYVFRKCVKGSTIYFSAGEVGAGRGVEWSVCVCWSGGRGKGGVGLFFLSQIFFLLFFFLPTKSKNNYFFYMAREPIYSLRMGKATHQR